MKMCPNELNTILAIGRLFEVEPLKPTKKKNYYYYVFIMFCVQYVYEKM